MAANHYPDGLTIEVITALQREINDELRREGYLVQSAGPEFVGEHRPIPTPRLTADHSSTRTDGSPRRSLPIGDGDARNLHRSNGRRERPADAVASSSGSG
jgi:hypothetical protein